MTTQRSDFRLIHRLRVRWAEVDMQKIVFNGHYLMYLDTAISDYWRAMAFPYEAGMQALGGDLYVKKASLEYHGSARYDDLLDVGLRCQRIGNSSITFTGAIFVADSLLITAELIYVFADPTTQTSKPVPETLRQTLEAFEAGKSMTHLQLGDWDTLRDSASQVREAVFVQEQGIDAEIVWDELDQTAMHAVIFNGMQVAVASGRLLQSKPHKGRIGRMATHRGVRGGKLGRDVLVALVDASRARGDHEVTLHAQCSAKDFYIKNGFVARGDTFVEAGIPHIAMVKTLKPE